MKPVTPRVRLHILVLLVLSLTATTLCNASVVNDQKHWLEADLIIKGKLIETATQRGTDIGTIAVERILKSPIQSVGESFYTKGYNSGEIVIVANPMTPVGESHIFFLEEETEPRYTIVKVSRVEEETQVNLLDTGTIGLTLMIAITLVNLRTSPTVEATVLEENKKND